MAELVTVAEYDNVNDAYVLKSRLEAEGIRVFIKNETISSVLPSMSWALGGVKVQVNLHDGHRAYDILYADE